VTETVAQQYARIIALHRSQGATITLRRKNAKRGNWRNALFAWVGYAFLFFTVYLPVSQNEFRGWFLALVMALILGRIIRNDGRLKLHKTTFHWVLFYLVAGIAFVLLGYYRNTPGALFSSLVFVVWPLAYALMIEAVAQPTRIVNVLRVLVFAMIGIGAATIYFLAWTLGWLPDSLYVDPQLVYQVAFFGNSMQMIHLSLSSLIFLIPFTISGLYIYSPKFPHFLPQWVVWLALSCGLFTAFVGGRRALFLVLLATPVLILIFHSWLPSNLRLSPTRAILLTVALLVALFGTRAYLGNATGLTWGGTRDFFLSGFQFDIDPGANVRATQFSALIQGWKAHPLEGAGLGAGLADLVRNDERPWEYELQYVLLLYQIGLVGIVAYGAGVAWIYYQAIKMARSGSALGVHIVPVLVGTTAVLIANATNPYLQTFGHLWTLFLPIAMINSSLVFERSKHALAEPKSRDLSVAEARC
jgi:hypothetical protein